MTALLNIPIDDINGLSHRSKKLVKELGHNVLGDLSRVEFHEINKAIGFGQGKVLLKAFRAAGGEARFSKPDWSEEDWKEFIQGLVESEIVTWNEVAMAVCGELNPPQVGTAIASNKSFQKHFEPGKIMRSVMAWFYAQKGRCEVCGTRMYLEADHVDSKQAFGERGEDSGDADTLDNLQLLCKRCNVIKRPSHDLGGISFAPAQSVLVWILLALRPKTKNEFYELCRAHGLTMANIRFDEAWALAHWLARDGKYQISSS